jgi:molybdopterin molybdotransferase
VPEFFTVLSPSDALATLWRQLPLGLPSERIATRDALGRVTAETTHSPVDLPAFPRSSMDGYGVRAQDTFGASQTLPAYLRLVGEAVMGSAPQFTLKAGEAALVHTGG